MISTAAEWFESGVNTPLRAPMAHPLRQILAAIALDRAIVRPEAKSIIGASSNTPIRMRINASKIETLSNRNAATVETMIAIDAMPEITFGIVHRKDGPE